jgi:hypothetical protein
MLNVVVVSCDELGLPLEIYISTPVAAFGWLLYVDVQFWAVAVAVGGIGVLVATGALVEVAVAVLVAVGGSGVLVAVEVRVAVAVAVGVLVFVAVAVGGSGVLVATGALVAVAVDVLVAVGGIGVFVAVAVVPLLVEMTSCGAGLPWRETNVTESVLGPINAKL